MIRQGVCECIRTHNPGRSNAMKIIFILFILLIPVTGCSDEDAEANRAHVWKAQTDTMDKARAVEGMLQDSADTGRKQIEDQTQ